MIDLTTVEERKALAYRLQREHCRTFKAAAEMALRGNETARIRVMDAWEPVRNRLEAPEYHG